MPLFHVLAEHIENGAPWQGVFEAPSREPIAEQLAERGLMVVSCEQVSEPFSAEMNFLKRQRIDPKAENVPRTPAQRLRRRVLLICYGLGLGAVVILGTLFVNRAKEHLLRERQVPHSTPALPTQ